MVQSIAKPTRLLIILALSGFVLNGGLTKFGATLFNTLTHNGNAARMGQQALNLGPNTIPNPRAEEEQRLDPYAGMNMYEIMADRQATQHNEPRNIQRQPVVETNVPVETREVPIYAGIRNTTPQLPLQWRGYYPSLHDAEEGGNQEYYEGMRRHLALHNTHNFQNMRNIEPQVNVGRQRGEEIVEQENSSAQLEHLLQEDAKKVPLINRGVYTEKNVPFGKTSLAEEGSQAYYESMMKHLGIPDLISGPKVDKTGIANTIDVLSGDFAVNGADKRTIAVKRAEEQFKPAVQTEKTNVMAGQKTKTDLSLLQKEISNLATIDASAKDLTKTNPKKGYVFEKIKESPYRRNKKGQLAQKDQRGSIREQRDEKKDIKLFENKKGLPLAQVDREAKDLMAKGPERKSLEATSQRPKGLFAKKSPKANVPQNYNAGQKSVAMRDESDKSLMGIKDEMTKPAIFDNGNTSLAELETQEKQLRAQGQEFKGIQAKGNEQKSIATLEEGEKGLQSYEEGFKELAEVRQGPSQLDTIRIDAGQKQLKTQGKEFKGIQVQGNEQKGLANIEQTEKSIQSFEEGFKDLAEHREGPTQMNVHKIGQSQLTRTDQEPNQLQTIDNSGNVLPQVIHNEQTSLKANIEQTQDLATIGVEQRLPSVFETENKQLNTQEETTKDLVANEELDSRLPSVLQSEQKVIQNVSEGPISLQALNEKPSSLSAVGEQPSDLLKVTDEKNRLAQFHKTQAPIVTNEETGLTGQKKNPMPLTREQLHNLVSFEYYKSPMLFGQFLKGHPLMAQGMGLEFNKVTQPSQTKTEVSDVGHEKISIDSFGPKTQTQTDSRNESGRIDNQPQINLSGFGLKESKAPEKINLTSVFKAPYTQELETNYSKFSLEDLKRTGERIFNFPLSKLSGSDNIIAGLKTDQLGTYKPQGLSKFRYGNIMGRWSSQNFAQNFELSQKALLEKANKVWVESFKKVKELAKQHNDVLKASSAYFKTVFAAEPAKAERGELFYSQNLGELSQKQYTSIMKDMEIPIPRAAQVYAYAQQEEIEDERVDFVFMNTYIDPRPASVIKPTPLAQMDWPRLTNHYKTRPASFKLLQLKAFLEPKPQFMIREALLDLPYFNLTLDFEELCIEHFPVSKCQEVSINMYGLYQRFAKVDKRNYAIIKAAVEKVIDDVFTAENAELDDGADEPRLYTAPGVDKLYASAQHMYDRLEFLLYRHAAA